MVESGSSGEKQRYAVNMVAGLLLPLYGTDLVLPNVAVAEIVDYREPVPISGAPPWFLGVHKWRGLEVPLISYEALNGKPPPANLRPERIAVLNGVGGKPDLPFLAFASQGIPRLVRIHSDEIERAEKKKGPADAMMVRLKEDYAAIPNINLLEQMIVRARAAA